MWCRVSRVFATVVFGRCVAAKVVVLLLSKTVILRFNPLIITSSTSPTRRSRGPDPAGIAMQ